MNNDIIFSKKISSKKRSYYFHVKIASNGSKYLTIGEQIIRKGKDDYECHRVMIFDDLFDEFVKVLNEIKAHMN